MYARVLYTFKLRNKTVLLRERKRLTTRRVASTHSAVLTGRGGGPHLGLASGVPHPALARGPGTEVPPTWDWGTPPPPGPGVPPPPGTGGPPHLGLGYPPTPTWAWGTPLCMVLGTPHLGLGYPPPPGTGVRPRKGPGI